ncbi:MAG: 3'-5' exonuclease [Thermoflexales bacterium]|nr:3'-5' exonuclease [Thermoflexales bacterium]
MSTVNRLQARQEAIQVARAEIELKPVYLDTETTGLESNDEIVDICVLDHDGAVLVDSLVNPQRKIPRDAMRIHGITDQMVKNAPSWADIWPEVEAALVGRRVAIYNAEFDVRMMRQSHQKYRMHWGLRDTSYVCIMKLYAQFCGEWNYSYSSWRWQKLETAGRQCRIALPNAHRARADTLLAREVLRYMAAFDFR